MEIFEHSKQVLQLSDVSSQTWLINSMRQLFLLQARITGAADTSFLRMSNRFKSEPSVTLRWPVADAVKEERSIRYIMFD